jgi:hypothetical protein
MTKRIRRIPRIDSPLQLQSVKSRVRKWERKQSPGTGDYVILPDGNYPKWEHNNGCRLGSDGIREVHSSWRDKEKSIDAVEYQRKRSTEWSYPCLTITNGEFYLQKNGDIDNSGSNYFYNVSRTAKLIDTGQSRMGDF